MFKRLKKIYNKISEIKESDNLPKYPWNVLITGTWISTQQLFQCLDMWFNEARKVLTAACNIKHKNCINTSLARFQFWIRNFWKLNSVVLFLKHFLRSWPEKKTVKPRLVNVQDDSEEVKN